MQKFNRLYKIYLLRKIALTKQPIKDYFFTQVSEFKNSIFTISAVLCEYLVFLCVTIDLKLEFFIILRSYIPFVNFSVSVTPLLRTAFKAMAYSFKMPNDHSIRSLK